MQEVVEVSELKQLIKELVHSQKETDAKFKETDAKFKETDAKFKETDAKFKETDAKFKETDLRINKAFNLFEVQWGKLMESLVEGDLVKLLNERGIKVNDTQTRRKGSHEGIDYEFDIIARNGTEIVIVEVKTTLKVDDVKKFIKKLASARKWLHEYDDCTIYGAVAFLQASAGSERFAENEHLFVIRATGNSSSIINPTDFIPKQF